MSQTARSLLADLLSRDAHRVWAAACTVNSWRRSQALARLAESLPEIERATAGLDLGGALFSNNERLRQAIATLQAQRDGLCRCWLYPQFLTYDPPKEEQAGDVAVLSTSPPDWTMTYRCRCTHCGAEYEVEQGEYHLTWWRWRGLD